MEPAESPIAAPTYFVFTFIVYEADKDSFSVGGNRYYARDHGFKDGDRVKVAISKVPG